MTYRPTVVAFDVVETLFSLEALGRRFMEVGLPPGALDVWFARFLRDAFSLALAWDFKPFREVASATLWQLLEEHGIAPDKDRVEQIMKGFSELEPHPDVRPAMRELRNAGLRLVALTNGGAENTRILFQKAGLMEMMERVISIDEVRRWKPAREVYLHAAQVMNTAPEDLALVAAHPWDTQGAGRAGLTTGWVGRKGESFPAFMAQPDVRGKTLEGVARELLKLPRRKGP